MLFMLVPLERFGFYLMYCLFHLLTSSVLTKHIDTYRETSSSSKLSSPQKIIISQSQSNSSIFINKMLNKTTNCSIKSNQCSKELNLVCDQSSGKCKCPLETPVRLSDEIPCLKYKHLGDLCIHSSECSLTPNSICVATFLFSVKVLSKTPTYKQWFFYNKIHNDDDMNYLLNKLYGRCRCQKGFRAVRPLECIYSGIETPFRCHHETDCLSVKAKCEQSRCVCSLGSHYDQLKGHCDEFINLYGQFCASSSDCFSQHSNMECKNSICICSRNYYYQNNTGCVHKDICTDGNIWNSTMRACQSSSMNTFTFCTFLIKLFPLLLIIIIIFNLLCCIRSRKIHRNQEVHDLSRRYTLADYDEGSRPMNQVNNVQSYSLLSLPDYETVFHSGTTAVAVTAACSFEERLPTYEEAIVLSLKNNDDDHHQITSNLIQKGNFLD